MLGELARGPAGESPRVRVVSIFVGGGTPTALAESELERLAAALGRIATRDDVCEFTVEANPASLDGAKADVLRAAGVSRISLGAQSFHAGELETLGRIHGPNDIARTVELIRRAGFRRLNLDLIFGIPGQTPASWSESLRRAIDLGPDHLACYALTYEPGTSLHERLVAGLIRPCDEATAPAMYEHAMDVLSAAAHDHYEISNFARPGGRCLHNLGYWTGEPYLGVGPASAAYLDGVRTRNVEDVEEYAERIRAGRSPVVDREELTGAAKAGELAMLRLRLIEGIDLADFRRRTGFDARRLFRQAIEVHEAAGRLAVTDTHVRLTRAGVMVADSVIGDFLAECGGLP